MPEGCRAYISVKQDTKALYNKERQRAFLSSLAVEFLLCFVAYLKFLRLASYSFFIQADMPESPFITERSPHVHDGFIGNQ